MTPYQTRVAKDAPGITDIAVVNGLLAKAARDGVMLVAVDVLALPGGDRLYSGKVRALPTGEQANAIAVEHLLQAAAALQLAQPKKARRK
jgi:hypothetical protein